MKAFFRSRFVAEKLKYTKYSRFFPPRECAKILSLAFT